MKTTSREQINIKNEEHQKHNHNRLVSKLLLNFSFHFHAVSLAYWFEVWNVMMKVGWMTRINEIKKHGKLLTQFEAIIKMKTRKIIL